MGSSARARSIGGITEMAGPTNGIKARRPLKIPRRSANGTPITDKAIVKSSPIIVIEASCPRNHR
jgi:hypothetical protein